MFANKKHEAADKELKNENNDRAIILYTEALTLTPNDCNILSDRGVAYLNLKDKELCLKDLDLAIELQPNYSFRYACRAYAKQHFGDKNGAIIDYQKAIDLDPEDSVSHNNLGLVLEEKGLQKEAQERFKIADKLSKIEDGLLDVIDDLDGSTSSKSSSSETIPTSKEVHSSTSQEIKKVFSSKSQFKEFLRFIKNGFKIK